MILLSQPPQYWDYSVNHHAWLISAFLCSWDKGQEQQRCWLCFFQTASCPQHHPPPDFWWFERNKVLFVWASEFSDFLLSVFLLLLYSSCRIFQGHCPNEEGQVYVCHIWQVWRSLT
jgi:hypothetical protein